MYQDLDVHDENPLTHQHLIGYNDLRFYKSNRADILLLLLLLLLRIRKLRARLFALRVRSIGSDAWR